MTEHLDYEEHDPGCRGTFSLVSPPRLVAIVGAHHHHRHPGAIVPGRLLLDRFHASLDVQEMTDTDRSAIRNPPSRNAFSDA